MSTAPTPPSRQDRFNLIMDELAASGRVEIEVLMQKLHISAATARRDLDQLAAQGLLVRTRGGALPRTLSYDLPARYRKEGTSNAKADIARLANELVKEGDVVGLSGGTTCTEIARVLGAREEGLGPGERAAPALTVVTNAINIAAMLAVRESVKVMVPGGILHSRSYELVGDFALPVLDAVVLDIAFIGVNSIDEVNGATVRDEAEAQINAALASRAARAYVVAETAKFGTASFARVQCSFDGWITENGITPW